jgi:dethiobiotin synthetase
LKKALFITATGTNIGKTLITAGIAGALKQAKKDFAVYKAIQTGSRCFGSLKPDGSIERGDLDQIRYYLNDSDLPTACSYEFLDPVAPLAADLDGLIEPKKLQEDFKALAQQHEILLIEGAGGVRVPITQHYDMRDLMADLKIPVLLVSSPFLGSINHILLSVEALQARNIPIAGLLLNGGIEYGEKADSHIDPAIQTLEKTLLPFLTVPYLGWMPDIKPLEAGVFSKESPQLTLFEELVQKLSLI